MPTIRRADLIRLPNLLSLARIPLAAVFPWFADRPALALAILCAAGVTDVLDGWTARRSGQATALGAVVDPIADKVFAITVVWTLVAHGRMPPWGVPALLAREILEAPLVVWILASKTVRRARRMEARANIPGKVATIVQFGAVGAALLLPALLDGMLVIAAICGVVAGGCYWRRELGRRSKGTIRTPSAG